MTEKQLLELQTHLNMILSKEASPDNLLTAIQEATGALENTGKAMASQLNQRLIGGAGKPVRILVHTDKGFQFGYDIEVVG